MKKYKNLFAVFILLIVSACHLVSQNPPAQKPDRTKELIESLRVPAEDKSLPEALKAPQQPATAPENPVRIALLLPLSGTNQKLGESMLDAAELAIADIGKKNLVLLPLDSGKDAASAVSAMNQAIAKKADIVLGPLFGASTAAIAPIAQQANMNVISFSNEKKLAGPNIFLLGFAPDEQVKRIVSYTLQKGLKRFSGYAPDSEYGKLVMGEFQKDVIAGGGNIGFSDFYKSSSEARIDLSKAATITPENTQSAFIPEGGSRLAEISAIIAKNSNEKGKIQLIGSGQWDDPSILSAPDVIGGWFAGAPPKLHADFETHFNQVYHYVPGRISSLAYDGVALVAHLAGGPSGANFSKAAITNPRGFMGVNGIFRFREDGICERGLSVLQVTPAGFEEIDPAPESFNQ